jgi:3-oxoacyl-[acyl-carrier protein] reductase
LDLGLDGRACIVTGASRGIGLATARMLAQEGARVLLVARGGEALRAAAASCGQACEPLELDVTASDAGERLLAECVGRL